MVVRTIKVVHMVPKPASWGVPTMPHSARRRSTPIERLEWQKGGILWRSSLTISVSPSWRWLMTGGEISPED